MITKKVKDHIVNQTPTCGIVRGILNRADYEGVNIAEAINIQPTKAHFHRTFDEIYFVLDGELQLRFHDPQNARTWDEVLRANELCVITKGVHHVVINPMAGEQEVKCKLDYFDLTAHAKREDLLSYILEVNPRTCVLVHGDPAALEWFQHELQNRRPDMRVVIPAPGKEISL